MEEAIEINGEWPVLNGQVLHELLCTEMWHHDRIAEPANVIYLKLNETWCRHYFDCGIIFWRTEKKAPKEYAMKEFNSYFKVIDLAKKFKLNGLVICSIEPTLLANGTETKFSFLNGASIIFSNINDITSYRT